MGVTAFATTVGHNPVAGEIVNEDGSVNVGIQPTLRLGFAFGKDKKTTVDLTTAEVQGKYIVVYYVGLNIDEPDVEITFPLKQSGIVTGKRLPSWQPHIFTENNRVKTPPLQISPKHCMPMARVQRRTTHKGRKINIIHQARKTVAQNATTTLQAMAKNHITPTLNFSPPPRMTPPPSPSGFPGSPRGRRKKI